MQIITKVHKWSDSGRWFDTRFRGFCKPGPRVGHKPQNICKGNCCIPLPTAHSYETLSSTRITHNICGMKDYFLVMICCLLCQKSQAMLFEDHGSCTTEDIFPMVSMMESVWSWAFLSIWWIDIIQRNEAYLSQFVVHFCPSFYFGGVGGKGRLK